MIEIHPQSRTIGVGSVSKFDRDASRPIEALRVVLRELSAVVRCMSDAQYTTSKVGVFSSSIGCHVRHTLDHIAALVTGVERGFLDYDQRERGTDVEFCREAAIDTIEQLDESLQSITPEMFAWPIELTIMPTADGPCVDVASTVGREIAFVQSHTIHHNAILAAMCATLGIVLPDRFGYAPSTVAHLNQDACAPSPSFH